MEGKFLDVRYDGRWKLVEAEEDYERFCGEVGKVFGIPLKVVQELSGVYTGKGGAIGVISDEESYLRCIKLMPLGGIEIIAINLVHGHSAVIRSEQFSLFPQGTAKLTFNNQQTQTDQTRSFKHKPRRETNATFNHNKNEEKREFKKLLNREFFSIKQLILNELYSNSKQDQLIEKETVCKGCSNRLFKAITYQCAQCEEYFFCEECEEKYAFSHGHPFIKLRPKMSLKTIKEQESSFASQLLSCKKCLFNSLQLTSITDEV